MATAKSAGSGQTSRKVVGRRDLARDVAAKTGLTQSQASQVVEITLKTIRESLGEGKEVRLVGFGSFKVRTHAARKSVNPRTRERLEVPARNRVRFSPGKELSATVSGFDPEPGEPTEIPLPPKPKPDPKPKPSPKRQSITKKRG